MHDDEHLHIATGLPRVAIMTFIEYYESHESRLQENVSGRRRMMTFEEEILAFFIHFRHYITDGLLSLISNPTIERTTLLRSRERVRNVLAQYCSRFISLGDSITRKANSFRYLSKYVTLIIDGVEQPVPGTADCLSDSYFYSGKKRQHSISILIGINPETGKILYMSPSVGGSISDVNLARLDSSSISSTLDADELVIADEGFNGIPWCATAPAHDIEFRTFFNSKRIRVEQAIGACKRFGACRDKLRVSLSFQERILLSHKQYWTIAAMLVNEYLNY